MRHHPRPEPTVRWVAWVGLAVLAGCGRIETVPPPTGDAVPGEVVVVRTGTVPFRVGRIRASAGSGGLRVELLRVGPGEEDAALASLRRDPSVLAADRNLRVFRIDDRAEAERLASGRSALLADLPADPKLWECAPAFAVPRLDGSVASCDGFGPGRATWQWNLWRIRAPEAWRWSDGTEVVVGVLDDGFDLDHPELRTRYVLASSGCPLDTVDGGMDPSGGQGHGTHVAGIVAASADGAGIVGVAPGARILPLRVLGPVGGTTYGAVAGLLCAVERGARVLNLSWGSFRPSAVEEAVLRWAAGRAVIVAAAGNAYGIGNPPVYPAAFADRVPGLIAVAASTPQDRIASFSSAGPHVTVAAPGTSVYSTIPVAAGGYGFLQGTSMSAPHVAGIAALVLARNPGLSPDRVKELIARTAFAPCPGYPRPDLPEPGRCGAYAAPAGSYGWGIADARAAVEAVR